MSGVILAVPDRPEAALRVLSGAARLAELTNCGRVNVLSIRTPPISTIVLSEEVLTKERERRIRSEEGERTEILKGIFEGWVRSKAAANFTADWTDIEGVADELVAEWGRRADFIVLKRPMNRQLDQERRAIRAALFDTCRPVLVIPPDGPTTPFGRRIAIAWRDDSRTLKAVLSGLRCASQAEEIHVLAGKRDAAPAPGLPSIFQEHGIAARLHVLPITGQRAFGETLLRTAHQLGADMLVMGAFARNPVRTLILGGVTRHMLAVADLPVLMRH
jgi:nucleotide-binding universal stress UspA family protein